MRCSNCGEPIEEGRLFCLNCGQEVQWVPDYDSFGDYMVCLLYTSDAADE